MEPKNDPFFVDGFAAAYGAKQVGAIIHGNGLNHDEMAECEAAKGLVPVKMKDHTRLYKMPIQP